LSGLSRGRRWALWAGGLCAALALSPPVDAAASRSLVVHMVQHLVLVTVAAPALGFGVPWAPGRRHWGAWLTAGVVASSLALWVWHAPALFDAAERHVALHMLEHLSFLGTATLLWAVAWGPGAWRRARAGLGVFGLFAATLPAIVLGAALTLAAGPWYAAYPSLADQRIAGALMWAAGSAPGLVGAALLFAWWLSGADPADALSGAKRTTGWSRGA
jgi:putative membrane protein